MLVRCRAVTTIRPRTVPNTRAKTAERDDEHQISVIGQVHALDGLAHHGLRTLDVDGISTALRRVKVARPLGQVVEVLPSGGLVNLELYQVRPVRREDDVKQPRTVRTDLTKGKKYEKQGRVKSVAETTGTNIMFGIDSSIRRNDHGYVSKVIEAEKRGPPTRTERTRMHLGIEIRRRWNKWLSGNYSPPRRPHTHNQPLFVHSRSLVTFFASTEAQQR